MNERDFIKYLSLLRQYRELSTLTQQEMANLMGVSFQSVNRWEKTEFSTCTVKHLINYIKILNNRGFVIPVSREPK